MDVAKVIVWLRKRLDVRRGGGTLARVSHSNLRRRQEKGVPTGHELMWPTETLRCRWVLRCLGPAAELQFAPAVNAQDGCGLGPQASQTDGTETCAADPELTVFYTVYCRTNFLYDLVISALQNVQ